MNRQVLDMFLRANTGCKITVFIRGEENGFEATLNEHDEMGIRVHAKSPLYIFYSSIAYLEMHKVETITE